MNDVAARARDPSPWLAAAVQRFCTDNLLKTAGTIAFMALFFPAYFFVLQHPSRPLTTMPLTPVDAWVPFSPLALPVYASLWIYVSLPASLLDRRARLYAYGAAAAGMCLVGLACFFAWPTAVPPNAIDWTRHPGYGVLKGVDASGNACPSLHVASAVFSCFWLHWLLRELHAGPRIRGFNVAWCIAIVLSTLSTRQHVALDALAGALLGTGFALGTRRWIDAE
ncbi:MAG TPA: phosphatase PAP2 family protein [Burkholderiaceae bacterium]|nr:phosphatase PAP2 family protein [Burkholderiaceae bacterium]